MDQKRESPHDEELLQSAEYVFSEEMKSWSCASGNKNLWKALENTLGSPNAIPIFESKIFIAVIVDPSHE